ncbi:reductive dehalogenase [Dehalogenimonas etheniformans]|uniref:Reductive dehalogenase n=1 Tax=Dehalogenimonas etheniformans TaxID=1536648 RepID=A0A2P5PAB3_9CHLR|nr:reductive dehalogenase [Dehalogenimonas etheniformans]PPD59232.1 reductive dehalogenase [Dehalogenimonas etheniformans]QNT75783.1 reductive dehalogenase [Dehalogenimonas etheniformans]
MSIYHSTLNRRDFIKNLGLAGAGIGAAAVAAPMFHDLDEAISAPTAGWKRPWWVKSKDEPTVEIDWSQIKRYDHRTTAHSAYPNAQHWGKDRWMEAVAQGKVKDAALKGTPGWELRDYALYWCGDAFDLWPKRSPLWMGRTEFNNTPEKLGFPKWQGTPEENTRMVRAAAIHVGATQIGTAELAGNERKLVYTYNRTGPTGSSTGTGWIDKWPPPVGNWVKFEFQDVDVGYTAAIDGVEDSLCVLPDRPLWDISVMIPMAKESWRTTSADEMSSTMIASEANKARYRMFHQSVLPGLQSFIRALGYHSYAYPKGDGPGGTLPAEASAVLGGVSEMGRSSEICINPEYGPVTGYYSIITDLPLEPCKPIDAGIFRFCHTCRKCAEACPSGSISKDSEPSWEIPNFDYKVPNMINNPGKKLFWSDMTACQASSGYFNKCNHLCRGVCTMNVNAAAMIHEVVKGTLSTTPVFNGFLWNMGKSFGYGTLSAEDWWEMAPGLPAWGTFPTLNTTRGV